MASLFEIGKTGVQAYRQALSVTGQNIANINTDGYNKRSADISEVAGVTGGPTNVSDSTGLGVRVSNVRRSFDAYLADKTRTSQSDYEMLNDFVSKLSDLENMLLPSGSDLGVFIGRFFDTLQDVASNPDSISARTVSLEAGKALASAFNSYDDQFKNFKTNSIKQIDIKIEEANLYINQLVEINKLIATSGSSDASNDVLDARDKLLIDLSKLLNFTVDYAGTGEAIVRLGDSGNGAFLVNRAKGSTISSSYDDKSVSLVINEGGGRKNPGIFSSGIIYGISNFYNLVDSVSSEISQLAEQFSNDVNEIQTSGIDLNGKSGKAMFSVNSMLPQANFTNKSQLKFNIIEGDPSKIIQEKILVNYSKINNNWEIRDSKGLTSAIGNKINFNGFEVEIIGQPQDSDGFQISPSLTKAGAMKFHLQNPEDFAAASKNLVSKSASNVGDVELNIIGTTTQTDNDYPSKIDEVFSSSGNPLVATTFLKDGPVTTIPSTTKSINLNSLGNQSSATFTISDADIKGFSSFSIKLTDSSNDEEITISSAATDPGDGIRTVEEFANLLNSGLMLDGKSQHDFKKLGLFATGSNGYLTIASSSLDIHSSSILSRGNSFTPSITNLTADETVASNLQIFTRDGRHVSGTSLNAIQIASLIKKENGFLESAEYRNDYLNNNYRGTNITRKTASGDFVSSFGSNLSYNKQETDMDGLLTSKTVSLIETTLRETSLNYTAATTVRGGESTYNNSGGTLGTSAITQIPLQSTTGFPSAGGTIKIGSEYFTYTGVSGNNLTGVTRAQEGSTAEDHAHSAAVTLVIGSGDIMSSSGTITVADTSAFASAGAIQIGDELFTYTGKTGTTFTGVTRAVSSSTAAKHDRNTTISQALDPTATTINVASTTGYPAAGTLLIGSEYVTYTGVTATSFTGVTRGTTVNTLTSTAAAHANGASIKDFSSGIITLDGTKIHSKELNSYISIACEKDESGRILTVTGYDLDGLYQTETIPGGNATTAVGTKVFSRVRNISIDGDSAGKITIGTEAVGYTLKVINDDNIEKTANVPVGSSAFYLANKLNTDLAGTGVNVSANTRVLLGPFDDGVSGAITFDLKGKNSDAVSINASIDASDISALAKRINEYSSQTGLLATVTSDFKKIIIESKDGYDINLKNITAPSDFYLEAFGKDFEKISENDSQLNSKLLIDISNTKKVSANIKGEIKFTSSETFTTQINSGVSKVALIDSLTNGYINIDRNKTGEVVTIKPEIFDDLDNSLGSPDGKKAIVGLSKYGIDLNQKDYKLFVSDDDSLFTSNRPASSGTITLDGALKDANDLNAVVTIYCSADESGNTFTVTGTNASGTTITEQIIGARATDDDSLFTIGNPGSAGAISLNGSLRSVDNLNAAVTIFSSADESKNTFTVTGTNSSGTIITEQITGATANNTAEGTKKFKTITSITTSVTPSGNIKIGTVANTAVGSTKFTTISSISSTVRPGGNINIGTVGHNDVNDDDSLVQLTNFSSGAISMNGVLRTSNYLGAKIQIKSREDTTGTTFVIAGLGLNNEVISESIAGSNGGVVTTTNIFKSVTSINSSGTSNGQIKIGTKAADGNWSTTIDANALNIDTQKEISTALLSSLRSQTPTSQVKSVVLNALPQDGESVDLSFEGQVYTLKMVSGEVLVEGPETNRIKARFNGTSENINNLIAVSQTGTAATPLTINGLNSTSADSNGIIELTNPSGAGVITLDGALKDSTNLNSRITIKNLDNDDNTPFKFTITGTDQDGNVITDEITGVNGNNATNTGTKVFKTVIEVRVDGDHGEVEVGTTPAFVSSLGTRVSITATANESSNSFSLVGTGTDGLSKTETIFGPISGKTVVSSGLFRTIHSITPTSNTTGNIEIGTASGYELIATAEGTIEGAQLKLVSNTANTANAETFGLKEGTTTILGNFVVQPTTSSPAIGIEVTENNVKSNYTIKFDSKNVPVFFNSDGSAISGSPPSSITLSWNESSGTTDDDSLYNGNMSAGVGIITDGILSTTDDDGLLISQSVTAGDLYLEGALAKSKSLNGKVTIFCNGNETSNSFVVSGYDTSGLFKTETISGVNNSTATGTISFNEISSITVANNSASTIKVGIQATQVVMEPQVITITPAGSDVGEKYTITGLDQFGNAQTEVLTAKAANETVTGTKVFTQISSIVPTSASASTVKVGTQKVGRLSLSNTIDKVDFKIESSPNADFVYGLKTQNIRAVIDNDSLKVSSFSGEPVKVDIPSGSIQNSVAEKISLTNLPPEDLITFVMGGGARKISAEYDKFSQSEYTEDIPELTIKVDSSNNNKVEIFDKVSGHSIASRILDVNRVFEINNTKFQFSDETIVNNSFDFSSNKDGFGDNRNIVNILSLQGSDKSGGNKGNFQEIFNTTVAKVGSNVQASKLSLASASSTLDAAEASQSEFAGVNLDEEAAHLLEFQQAYQASARILQTAKEMFQSLIEVV